MQLAEIQSNKTMSSREIAQLCQKRHDNVCNDIRILNETYEKMGLLKIKDTLYTNEQNGQQYREYLLTKEQSIDLVTGYNRELRIAINRRWQELESSQSLALPNFTDPAEAAEAWAKEYREKQALAIENQTLKPKAEQWQRFIDTDGLLPSRTIGKLLGFKSAQEFNKAIKEKRVAFKADDGTWQFYADFKDKEIGKMVAWEKGEYNKAGTQLKWHTKAVEYFANLFNRQVQGGI